MTQPKRGPGRRPLVTERRAAGAAHRGGGVRQRSPQVASRPLARPALALSPATPHVGLRTGRLRLVDDTAPKGRHACAEIEGALTVPAESVAA